MKILPKVCILFLLLPAPLCAQPGVRMSADFLPLEVGNRWVYDLLNENQAEGAKAFEPRDCAAPLPRAYQWADGSAYVTHVELVRKARALKRS